jgi:hypothetical protein
MLGKEKLEEKRHNSNFDRLRSSFILYPYMWVYYQLYRVSKFKLLRILII